MTRSMRARGICVAWATALGALGCSSDPSGAADAAAVDASAPDAVAVAPDASAVVPEGGLDAATPDTGPADAGACTALVNAGPQVSKTSHPEAPPAMTGGTIVDGTYFLTAMDKYNGKMGSNTHQETWRFSGGKVEVASAQSDKPAALKASGTYTVSGNQVTLTITCPMTATFVSPYTATATELRTINSDDPNEMHTFTRQP